MAEKKKSGDRKIAKNSKAFHDYFVEDSYEAGIELAGTEVKSIRMGNVNLKDAFCTDQGRADDARSEMHISPYEKGNIFNKEPLPPPPPAHAQAGDPAAVRQDQAGRLHPRPSEPVFPRPQGQGGGRRCARAKSSMTSGTPQRKKDAKREMDRALKMQQR